MLQPGRAPGVDKSCIPTQGHSLEPGQEPGGDLPISHWGVPGQFPIGGPGYSPGLEPGRELCIERNIAMTIEHSLKLCIERIVGMQK